ncbi:MAG: chemotaxis protein CheC [Pseudomonadota bacterium]|nr:chemotaxis protein CheC [Pseudomonadota bacterium]
MAEDPREILSEEERDVLQEVMNICFGNAAAELAEVIDIYVVLSVPTVKVISADGLPNYIKTEIRDYRDVSLIEQNFWSKFKGAALLVFSSGAGKALLSIIGGSQNEPTLKSDPLRILERETLMEVGNILVGACVGKVAELLGDVVSYSPPRLLVGNLDGESLSENILDARNIVIVMQAVFNFQDRDVNGYMFIITNHESIGWLKEAIHVFLKQYE